MRSTILKKFLLLALAVLLLNLTAGCNRVSRPDPTPLRIVTSVTVFYKNGPINTQRHYTTDGKMQQILDYLRLIKPYGSPEEDPETAAGSDFHIVLSYSDGFQNFYRQKGDRFLQGTDGRWKKIDPSKAEELSRILGQLESDTAL